MSTAEAVLRVEHVSHEYRRGRTVARVLNEISFDLARARTLAVVGESGAGKSTLARLVAGLERPALGRVEVDGRPPRIRSGRVSPVQMVFQHPGDALNRFCSIGSSVAEPLRRIPRRERGLRVAELLERVGLDASRARDRPALFSGGQLQRIVMARALAADPRVLLCDEPTSALDVSVQAQIVNLLLDLQVAHGFACVLVTHDLGVARVLADDVLVLRAGEMVELSPADTFFESPVAEYSQRLVATTTAQMLRSAGTVNPEFRSS